MAASYDAIFQRFDSPLMQRVREVAYGEDIGQHSWVSADELRRAAQQFSLGVGVRLLDLGCGACGPLAFLASTTGCVATGVDASASALQAGRLRAERLGVALRLLQHDLAQSLPFVEESFDAAIAVDVVIHLSDRAALYREVRRVLRPRGRFLLTDAGVITGEISSDEVARRSRSGTNHHVPPEFNEQCLMSAGFRVLETSDVTPQLLRAARGRVSAYRKYRAELLEVLGADGVARDEVYLATVIELSERGALSRFAYLAEAGG